MKQTFTREDEINEVHGVGTHVVLLGAGASIASTLRNPEKNKKKLPAMDNIVDVVDLQDIVARLSPSLRKLSQDFEKLYSELYQLGNYPFETYLIENQNSGLLQKT